MFTEVQLSQISDHGAILHDIEKQIESFRKGFAFAKLIKPAIVGDGISRFDRVEANNLASFYDQNKKGGKLIKFVPASGAASRMFKELFSFLETYTVSQDISEFKADRGFNSIYNFIERITEFAFYPELVELLEKNGVSIEGSLRKKEYHIIIGYLLLGHGLNYGQLPKGLLKFHKYAGVNRTPAEEHLVEAALYAKSGTGNAEVHFTISTEHAELFNKHINEVIGKYKEMYKLDYEIGFSEQKKSTDTIAVDMNNDPFLDKAGNLVFRPGGHGALIENLNDLDGDIVFIKNIDNVVPDLLKPETTLYKKALAGLLLQKQGKVFGYLDDLEGDTLNEIEINEITDFAKMELNVAIPSSFYDLNIKDKKEYLAQYLNRPIRVCGMVKNEGEPGGGPFWVKNAKGDISLQIIESSQIDPGDPAQKAIAQNATHFNPVDLICGITDHKGRKFDLLKFVDPETGFISIKSKDGRDLKAQELPGLWNGAMANWITIFVEVPVITFNPVKTVNDLLRETHC
ncbi:MAG: DUF4301 domain-containing protein [Bacteroidetes bacterium]|nr:MAG: DUF4301 domain-containing protein [Bacteroidota bacterium]